MQSFTHLTNILSQALGIWQSTKPKLNYNQEAVGWGPGHNKQTMSGSGSAMKKSKAELWKKDDEVSQ